MARPQDADLLAVLAGPIAEESVVSEVLAQLRAHDAIGQARDIASQWSGRARDALVGLPAGAPRDALASLCDYVVERTG